MLLLRSLFFAILIPGMVVGLIPYSVAGEEARSRPWDAVGLFALVPLSIGIAVLGACIRDFLAHGQGTLAPIDPPKHLVRAGLYRYVRNPMYLGALLVLIGQTLLFRSSALVLYHIAMVRCGERDGVFYEEPHLRREFGGPYDRYCRRVGRWVPRWPGVQHRAIAAGRGRNPAGPARILGIMKAVAEDLQKRRLSTLPRLTPSASRSSRLRSKRRRTA